MITYFVAHTVMTPADKSFVDFRLFKDPNFVAGMLFIFIVGLVLYATRALLPTLLETLLNYPVATTGLVTAPSGAGTMITMLIVGRLIGKVDLRLMLFFGFTITALSLWQMAHYSFDISQSDVIWPGVIQGVGMGLVFVPLSAATFATLNPEMRAQGTALFSLVRNIGSSIGISLVQTLLVRNTVIAHASMVERVTTASPAWNNPAMARAYDVGTPMGAAFLDGMVTQQAAMIAYIDDFWLMLFLTLAVTPLLLLIRPPAHTKAVAADAHAVMD
jgi:MFS transporter, DHA2 family, multidrug resistance protein